MVKKAITILLIVAMMMSLMVQPAFAAYQPELPSLYQTFNKYFMFGSFQGMNSFFGGNDATVRSMLQHHYNSWSPANELKPNALLDLNTAASNYNTVYNEVNADGSIDEEEAARLYAANTTLVLGSTSTQLNFLNQVRELNKTRGPEDQVKVKAHTLFWHNLTQQPAAFFREGFSNSSDAPWASKEVMLDRIDSYIQKVFERFAPYKDVLFSWDVVNEAIDDFSGFIRNGDDYQEGRWGYIFARPDITKDNLDRKDERLYEEAVWVRQAFESAAKYNKLYDLDLILVYNDFFDADKDYEPKLSATIKMLEPIYEQMKAEGVTFAVGLQNRNATSLDLDVFKDMYNKFSEVCDEIQTTESDTRSDLVANPNYSRDVLPYYLPNGKKNTAWTYSNWQNTPNAHVALVRNGWTASMANNPDIMREQADWQADQFDFLLENSKGNGGKLTLYAFDGVSDSSTFNRDKGAHIFMSGDYTAKMSYYAMIGSVARFELKKQLENLPEDSSAEAYTPDSWSRYTAAKQAANDILNVRIYDLDAVNNVKNAASALTAAVAELTDIAASLSEIKVNGTPLSDFAPGTHLYNMAIPVGGLPEVTATAADPAAKVDILQADGLPGKAVITVTSSDDTKKTIYTINFNVNMTLSSLKVDGVEVSGFTPDQYTYNLVVPYGPVPIVSAEPTDPGVTVTVLQAEGVPGQATIDLVTGSAKTTYTVNFNVDSSLKSLKVNGVEVNGFNPGTYVYNVYISDGTPSVSAVPKDPNAPITITQADTVPGQAKVTVGSGSSQLTYIVNFSNKANSNDEFNKPTLNTSIWHWVNEDPATWSLEKYPGYMTISPRAGDIYGSGTADAKNILLQNAPGDWTIETKIECSVRPHAPYQQGGIIAFQDVDNYIKLDWEANNTNGSTIIQACREVNGSASATSVNGNVVNDSNTLWLRMVKSGNVYSTYYSTDGSNFTQVGGNYTLNFSNVQAGLIAINGSGTNTDLDVKFDYFHSSANVFVPLPADKEALIELIESAQALNELHYTTDSWASLQTALNAAVAKKDDSAASQSDVDAARVNLQAAINALVYRGIATTLIGSDYVRPGSSFSVGVGFYNVSQDVYAEDLTISFDPEVFEFDAVTSENPNIKVLANELTDLGILRILAVNIGGLKEDIDSLLNVSFTVKAGVEDAVSVISITNAKLGVMPEGTLVRPLLSSKTITVKDDVIVDKSQLKAAIDAVQALYDRAVVGTSNGNYRLADKIKFQLAIAAAKSVYENSSATQQNVDDATAALNTAKAVFEASVITERSGDLNNFEGIDVGDLAIVAYYYGAKLGDENWEVAKIADVNNDGKVDIEDLAFIALRIKE